MTTQEFALALPVARQYLESCMNGPLALTASTRFARTLRWTDARALTCAYSRLKDEQLHNFDVGGKADSARADAWLQGHLEAMLGKRPGFVLVEDWQLWPTSGAIVDYSLPVVFVQDEVYYALVPGTSDFDLATTNICPRFIGFVLALPRPVLGIRLTATQLDDMAANVIAAYCGAYDGESYVLVMF